MEKNPSFYIFFGGNGSGFGKYRFENGIGICRHTGSKMESEYADIRKRINTDGEPEN
jgi:hypothetical protein